MIPVLYSATETNFNHNGLGKLNGLLKNTVVEGLNAEFELYLEYPVGGPKFDQIVNNALIMAKPNKYDDPHLFRIYEHKLSTNQERLEIYARSNTFDLAHNMVLNCVVNELSPQNAMNLMKSQAVDPCDFTFVSDISTPSSTVWKRRSLLSCIAGEEGSLIQYWGGEIKRGNKWLWLYKNRGTDRGVTIRHGRNMKGLTASYSISGLITAIVPYTILGYDEEGNENVITGDVVTSPNAFNFPYKFMEMVEFPLDEYGTETVVTDEDGYETTVMKMSLSDLNAAAADWFIENPDADVPSVHVEAELEDLSQVEEYAKFASLEKLMLGDTVTIFSEQFNVNIKAKVIKITYDGLADKHTGVEIGRVKSSRFEDLRSTIAQTVVEPIHNQLHAIGLAANGKNRIFRGVLTPTEGMIKNDIWYKPVGTGETELYRYNGAAWVLEKVSGGLLQGTIDAGSGDLDIINLNANNITTGSLAASFIQLSNGYDVEQAINSIETAENYTWIRYSDYSDGTGLYDTPTASTKYIGIAVNKSTDTPSNTKTDYAWSKFRGEDGAAGDTSYTWIRYSEHPDGTDMTASPTVDTLYIGIAANKTSATPSSIKGDYTWSRFKGTDGAPTYTWIRYSDYSDGTSPYGTPTAATKYIGVASNMSTPTPSNTKTDYTWSKFRGDDGMPQYTWVRYSDYADGTNLYATPTATTKYIGIAANKSSETPSNTKTDYAWSKFKGDDGNAGAPTYIWVRYSDYADGTDLYATPTASTKYIGLAHNKATSTPSDTKTDYTWSKFKGESGDPSYTWIRFSDYSDGTNLYATPTVNTKYIGIAANKTSSTPSSIKTDYAWSKIKGEDGTNGQSAYEAALTGGYEGDLADFYADLGLVEEIEGALGAIDTLDENLQTAREAIEEQGGILASLLGAQSITPAALVQLRALLAEIHRETAELSSKLSNQGGLVTILQNAADDVIGVLEVIIDNGVEEDVNFDELIQLYSIYLNAVTAARAEIDNLVETRITDLQSGQIDLISRIGNYEDRLQLLPSEILMTMGGDVSMSLTAQALSFLSDEYQTVIAKDQWKIMKQQMTVMSISSDELRIPRAISSEYFGVGRIKLLPSYSGSTMVGTDIVFLDDPAGL